MTKLQGVLGELQNILITLVGTIYFAERELRKPQAKSQINDYMGKQEEN